MFSNNPRVWVSLEAQRVWVPIFKAINLANIETSLKGVDEGRWRKRSMTLYGNSWLHFLSQAKNYDVVYSHDFNPLLSAHKIEMVHTNHKSGKARNNQAHSLQGHSIWETAKRTSATKTAENSLKIKNSPLSIIFWQDFGLSLFSELPGEFLCVNTQALIQEHIEAMKEQGFIEQSDSLKEILRWPVEWSSLNGIEEIRTPIVKVARYTGEKGQKRQFQIDGLSSPEEGAEGLSFPFNQKEKRKFSGSKYFQKGMEINIKRIANAQ